MSYNRAIKIWYTISEDEDEKNVLIVLLSYINPHKYIKVNTKSKES